MNIFWRREDRRRQEQFITKVEINEGGIDGWRTDGLMVVVWWFNVFFSLSLFYALI